MQAIFSLARQGRLTSNALRLKSPLIAIPRCFEGAYPWYPSMAEITPKKNPKLADDTMDETEVITRMMHVLHRFRLYDLETLDWSKPFGAQGIDSLEATALITTFEDEFHTIFEDRVFENFENLD